jgi:alkanesulfonate monooxygenase
VRYPKPPGEEDDALADSSIEYGIRVGIIGRQTEDEAWRVAVERFPEDRKGQIAHSMAMKVSDSHWHKQLSVRQDVTAGDTPYWLRPFQNYNTFCPYLVGSYDRVATELAAYIAQGFETFILDVPASEEELHHTGLVLGAARRAGAV